MMNPGKLRHRITIQEGSDQEDNWSDVATNIYAYIEPTGGSEFYAAQKVNAEATANVWIRYRSSIKPYMRVLFGTRIFDIVAPPINLKEENRWLRLICRELI